MEQARGRSGPGCRLYRIKRQDTAVTLVRTTLRYVIFIIVALFVLSIFLRNVLPGIAGASLLAAIVGFGRRASCATSSPGSSYS